MDRTYGKAKLKDRVEEAKKLYKFERPLTDEGRTDVFIQRSKHLFEDVYDYSKSYVTMVHSKVEIICKKHGSFFQTPNSHMSGRGCFDCNWVPTHTVNTFIENANKVHNNKYDYSKVNFIDMETKVIIICEFHGEFQQSPRCHARKD